MDQPSSTESRAITLRIKFKSASLDDFINRYGVDVSPGGIFIRTKQPVDVGTTLQFDFTLADGSAIRTPGSGVYTARGEDLENFGVKPDVYIDNSPDDFLKGRDAQIEKAVEVLKADIAAGKKKGGN